MVYEPHFLYRLKIVFVFLLVKLKFIHFLLPNSFREQLPTGWNNYMFWVAFISGGKKVFFDFHCKMVVTCWIALTDAPSNKSCMKIVSGSRKEIYPVKHSNKLAHKYVYGKYGVELDYSIDEEKVNLLEAKAGQCIIFCERTVHSSTDNITDDSRWALVGRIVTPETRVYTKKMLTDGIDQEITGIKKIQLNNWKSVLLRGQDRFGYNRS